MLNLPPFNLYAGNGLRIPAYRVSAQQDKWLVRLRKYIESWPKCSNDVRQIEKRFWARKGPAGDGGIGGGAFGP